MSSNLQTSNNELAAPVSAVGTKRPRALDLFCGAGGASVGLYRAGFDVVGVDHRSQPNYPFEFLEENALGVDVRDFDLVWASPPCQAFTAYRRRHGHVRERANLVGSIRNRLRSARGWVIENVVGAPLRHPVTLCSSSFGLDVRRHRLFECSFPVLAPTCAHSWQTPRFPPATNRTNLRCTVEVGPWRIPLDVQRRAMGIDWMSREELSQTVPPAYSEFLGRRALAALSGSAA